MWSENIYTKLNSLVWRLEHPTFTTVDFILCVNLCLYIMTSEKSSSWEPNQLRRYDLVLDQIPRLHFEDPKVDELMAQNVSWETSRQLRLVISGFSQP